MGGVDHPSRIMAGGVTGSFGGIGGISGGIGVITVAQISRHPGIHRAKHTVSVKGGGTIGLPSATIIRVAQVPASPSVRVSIGPGIRVSESPDV